MENTVTVRILRSKFIEDNSDVALISLDSLEHLVGQPVMISYYGEDGEIETITAIGIKNGIGRDCYSITSISNEEIVNGIYKDLPDVAQLVNGAVYVSYYAGSWSRVYIANNEVKQVDPIEEISVVFRDLKTGYRWFWRNSELFREDSFMSEDEIEKRLERVPNPLTFKASLYGGNLYPSGSTINQPKIILEVKNLNGTDVTAEFEFTVTSSRGEEPIIDSGLNYVILLNSLSSTIVYTITGVSQTLKKEITCDLDVEFFPEVYYGLTNNTSITRDFDTLITEETSRVLWNGREKLTLSFSDIQSMATFIFIPSIFHIIDRGLKILDKNGLDYLEDYNIYEDDALGYTVFIKKDTFTLNSFKQILTYE